MKEHLTFWSMSCAKGINLNKNNYLPTGYYKRVQKPTYSPRGLHAMMPAGFLAYYTGPTT